MLASSGLPFTSPSDGLTVFIREISTRGEIRGILVHDNREPQRPSTYLAESGTLAQTPQGPRLIMINGHVEQAENGGARLSMLKFDRYVFDLDQFAGPQREFNRDTSERYLPDLLHPPANLNRQVHGAFLAEAHNRISAPFYCLAFALIALVATGKGPMTRGSYALRLTAAGVIGAGLRLSAELLGPEYSMSWNTLDSSLKLFFSREVRGKAGEDLVEKQNAEMGLMPVVAEEASAYGYSAENRHMARAFLKGEKPSLTFDDGFEVVKILMAAYMSAEKGQTLDFPPAGLETFVPAVAKGNWKP